MSSFKYTSKTFTGNEVPGINDLFDAKYNINLRNLTLGHKSFSDNQTLITDNTILGYKALYDNISGSYNISIGSGSGGYNESGSGNIYLGYKAGSNPIFLNKSNILVVNNSDSSKPLIEGIFDSNNEGNGILNINNTINANKIGLYNSGKNYKVSLEVNESNVDKDTYSIILPSKKPISTGFVLKITDIGLEKITLDWGNPNSASQNNVIGLQDYTNVNIFIGHLQNPLLNIDTSDDICPKIDFSQEGGDILTNEDCGQNNIGLGQESLKTINIGSFNTAIGNNNMSQYLDGFYNTSLGYNALQNILEGNNNVSLGSGSMTNILNGSNNVSIGKNSLYSSKNGSNNTIIGFNAGYHLGDDSNNKIFIRTPPSEYSIYFNEISESCLQVLIIQDLEIGFKHFFSK